MGLVFIKLKPWDERTHKGQDVKSVAARASAYFATIRDAQIFAVLQPAVPELGNRRRLRDDAGGSRWHRP